MFNNYVLTVVTRYLTAILNLAVVLLSSHFLGATGLGFISMFILGIAINYQISSFFGGSALVYLTPRSNTASLLLVSYSGSVLVHLLLIPLYSIIAPFNPVYFPAFFCISIINAFLANNLFILLGKNKVETYNIISTFHILMQFLLFGLFIYKSESPDVNHYVIASAIAGFMALAGSSGAVLKEKGGKPENKLKTLKDIVTLGFFSEAGNILQLLSYRLNYFLINRWYGAAALGEFSLAIQITESLRIFSKGIATVEYSYYSATKSFKPRTAVTKKSIVYSTIFVLSGLAIILILPSGFLTTIFGLDFQNLKTIILFLAPGILFLSAGTIITPFFSGQGKHYINAMGSAISFLVTAIFAFMLIPAWGLTGAAIVNTLAYTAVTVYLFLAYKKHLKFV
jgi:O-antigen/teichoic acid export membrane protein